MKANPAQERWVLATEAVREALKTGEGPEYVDDSESLEGYNRWHAYHDLLDAQKDLIREMDALERRFTDARPYIQGSNGYFDPRGIVSGAGSKIDVLCAIFDARVTKAVNAEMEYSKATTSPTKALRETILATLDALSNSDGVIQADPAAATDEIMEQIA